MLKGKPPAPGPRLTRRVPPPDPTPEHMGSTDLVGLRRLSGGRSWRSPAGRFADGEVRGLAAAAASMPLGGRLGSGFLV